MILKLHEQNHFGHVGSGGHRDRNHVGRVNAGQLLQSAQNPIDIEANDVIVIPKSFF